MKSATVGKLVRSGRALMLTTLRGVMRPYYRAVYLAAAGSEGVLEALGDRSRDFDSLARDLRCADPMRDALRHWLDVGVGLGVLSKKKGAYAIASRFARKLAEPENDDLLALLIEATRLHYRLLTETPARVRESRWFTLADQDGELIARSSRVLEVLVQEAVADVVPKAEPVRLLEVGCGTGTHIRFAASLNPTLRAIGRELQTEVAAMATRNMAQWGLADRVTIEAGDVRERAVDESFDLLTLHQNIYYFPVDERVGFLRDLRRFLRPGGTLLLTTACAGGSAEMAILDLWAATTKGCGRLPAPDEMVAQLREAGFTDVEARSLLPGDRFYAFVGIA